MNRKPTTPYKKDVWKVESLPAAPVPELNTPELAGLLVVACQRIGRLERQLEEIHAGARGRNA